jgi:translocation and assembly module TamA
VRRSFRSLLCSVGAAALAAPALAADNYRVVYRGAPPGIADELQRLTNLSLERRPYATAAAVRRVGARDAKIVKDALAAAGYYAADVEFRIEETAPGEKIAAVFDIRPGPEFRIVEHVVVYDDPGDAARPATFAAAEIAVDGRADGAALQDNQQKFLNALWGSGYPAARSVGRRAEARLAEGTARAVYTFVSGPRAAFDGIEVSGAEHTDIDFLTALKTWEQGELFDRQRLVDYRDRLAETGVFSTIDVAPGAVAANGVVAVRVALSERERRTVGVGANYSTSEGPGARLFLEYRNLFGNAERARAELDGNAVRQSITFDLVRPLPAFPGAAFANFDFTNETTDAYDARSIELGAGLAKKWFEDRLETRGGLAVETSKVEPELAPTPTVREERNYFVSAPLSATWDTEDDPLLLSKGVRAALFATPYVGTDQFTRLEAIARSRVNFGADDRFTLAGRVRVAATAGQALRTLPVNKRVYSGGGSSVRGYGYREVGPLDANGVPIGGRSAVEAAAEARARVAERVQIAAFLDAGAVYAESFPDFAGNYFVGAGGGVRYLTGLGPIRLDVATPLEKRPTDRGFQIYISIGQPF